MPGTTSKRIEIERKDTGRLNILRVAGVQTIDSLVTVVDTLRHTNFQPPPPPHSSLHQLTHTQYQRLIIWGFSGRGR
jgi:hypothetical protein